MVYSGDDGGPWVATQNYVDVGGDPGAVTWHQPKKGARLMALLDKLGVGADGAPSGGGDEGEVGSGAVGELPALDAGAGADPATASAEVSDDGSGATGVSWGLGGLVAGLVVGALAMHYRRREAMRAPVAAEAEDAADGMAADRVVFGGGAGRSR